jgi:hypothetical protein
MPVAAAAGSEIDVDVTIAYLTDHPAGPRNAAGTLQYDDCNPKGLPQSEIGARLVVEADHGV